ncbi:MAG: hypothetical protein WBM50_26300 [Acidimicrobiales bacterium]
MAEATQIEFDLACWFTGDAATAAATEDGEESPPPNDYYIRNENNLLRTLTINPATNVAWLPDPGDPESTETVAYDTWLANQTDRPNRPGVWLDIEAGQVTAIEEQYVP